MHSVVRAKALLLVANASTTAAHCKRLLFMIGNMGFSCLARLEMGELAVLKVVKDARGMSAGCHQIVILRDRTEHLDLFV